MSFWTYILHCADGSYYTGHTDDLERQVAQHHDGTVMGYTRDRRPVELAWSQEFGTREEALAAEQQIKNWSRARKKRLIAGDWDQVGHFAMPPSERSVRSANPSTAPQPVIVLVRPQLGENIGKAARAMLNFGLTELRLVAPRDGWPNPSAGPAAAGADLVLEQAKVYDSLADAVHDCANVHATTVRKRGVTKPVLTPEQAARDIIAAPGRSAVVFGPERSGLETDDVALARSIITVPINPEFGSLNLAQAVILCAYEWSKHAQLAQPTIEDLLPPAPQVEFDGMFTQLTTMLEPLGYFEPAIRAAVTRRTLRTMLTKAAWNHFEVRTMRGVLTTLARKPRPLRDQD